MGSPSENAMNSLRGIHQRAIDSIMDGMLATYGENAQLVIAENMRTTGVNHVTGWVTHQTDQPYWRWIENNCDGVNNKEIAANLSKLTSVRVGQWALSQWKRRDTGISDKMRRAIAKVAAKRRSPILAVSTDDNLKTEVGFIAETSYVRDHFSMSPAKRRLLQDNLVLHEGWRAIVAALNDHAFFGLTTLRSESLQFMQGLEPLNTVTIAEIEAAAAPILHALRRTPERPVASYLTNGLDLLQLCLEWSSHALTWRALREFSGEC